MNPSTTAEPAVATAARHPRGLYTLFFTEMWERFSYYGMRALLVLFMVEGIKAGGLGLTDEVATSIYGLYTAGVYLAALPGGWIADRFLGAQRSVWYGGSIIACGHFTLAIPRTECFYLGLILVVIGTGLLKPNVSAIVGELYPEGGARRDAGFTVFYMGINLGAALGPLVCSALGEKVNWHYGFAAAGVGMVLGLVQYRLSGRHLGEAGRHPGHREGIRAKDRLLLGALISGLFLAVVLLITGVIHFSPVAVARATTYIIAAVALLYFACMFFFFHLDRTETARVAVIAILFLASALFWSGFEQAGSSLNLFAERYTQRLFFNYTIPAGWFQSLGAIFVILLAPAVAAVWVRLARYNLNPSLPTKFALGLALLGAGFLVMVGASRLVVAGRKAWPTWLISTYLLHSIGELCLSPVGLSSVTKLAPRRLVGQMMGIWFLGTSMGNLIAGLIAGRFSAEAVSEMPGRYLGIVATTAGTGILLALVARPIQKLMRGAD
ncbi:MAG TPA: peptide MFS transporter [Candidatus Acidoferrum sp.]|nr:peptide MFS transporter [Candidatus Acidoferrum sp.]